jgi:ElaB/YqjD/DUF883 family membrane-anchored ribosome-binding protein
MSEGSFSPKTWREALPLLVWGVIIFACGFEGIASLLHGEWLQVALGLGGMLGLTAMLIHWTRIKDNFTDIRWLMAAVMLTLVVAALSPYIEQRRWPFSTVIRDPPTDEDIDRATASIRMQLSGAIEGQEELRRENERLRQALTRQQTAAPSISVSPNLSASDIATKIGVWKTIDQRMSDLSHLLDQGDDMLDHWAVNARSDRNNLAKNADALASSIQSFRAKLDELRNLYGKDTDIATALSPVYVPGGRVEPTATIFLSLPNSLTQFSSHLREMSDPLPENMETETIPFIGAVRRDLNALRDWQSQVRQIAAEENKQLSKLDRK